MKIHRLKLFTINYDQQLEFYTQTLGIDLIDKTKSSFTLRIGITDLEFEKSENFHPYHFGINIPSHSEMDALNFVKIRTTILKHENSEIIDYKNWNAKAVYFYDTDKNLVELIARNNLGYSKNDDFDSSSFKEISEIGLATSSIEKEFGLLNSVCGLQIYDGDFDRFCAIGDERGLFICINKDLKKWFPTNDQAYASHFTMVMEEKEKNYKVTYDGTLSIELVYRVGSSFRSDL